MTNEKKVDESRHWLDEIYKDFEKKGGLEKNPYHGKPLPEKFFSGSVYDNFLKTAKDAGYVPYWIEVQNEIKKLLISIKNKLELAIQNSDEIDCLFKDVNKKIKQYNSVCPPSMQRMKLERENFDERYNSWF